MTQGPAAAASSEGLDEIQVAKFLGTSVDMLQKVYANHLDQHAQHEIGEAVTDLF